MDRKEIEKRIDEFLEELSSNPKVRRMIASLEGKY